MPTSREHIDYQTPAGPTISANLVFKGFRDSVFSGNLVELVYFFIIFCLSSFPLEPIFDLTLKPGRLRDQVIIQA